MARNHYEVLSFAPPAAGALLNSSSLKTAYRKALLLHHPDKFAHQISPSKTISDIPSIDEITQAYQTLSNPRTQSKYDQELRSLQEKSKNNKTFGNTSVGLEIIDLDDMLYDEKESIWTRECRCGTGGGFEVTEQDLNAVMDGLRPGDPSEILLGCSGCSLRLKVSFAAVE